MMKNFIKNRKEWIGVLICFCMILANAGYAAETVSANKNMVITYPEKNSVVSGYFIPVSWKDPVVEETKTRYPENYQQSGKTYQITVSDKSQNIMLKATVSGQNYVIFNYEDIRGLLSSDYYFAEVQDADTFLSARAVRFFYQEPANDAAISTQEPVTTSSQVVSDSQTAVSAESPDAQILSLTSSSPCAYCLTDNWPGMLVYFFNQTTYEKKVTIDCNQDRWSSMTFAPSFSGPFFISISSGNFKLTYNDSVAYSVKCINIYPWAYTIVPLP